MFVKERENTTGFRKMMTLTNLQEGGIQMSLVKMSVVAIIVVSLVVSASAAPIYFDFGWSGRTSGNYNNITNSTSDALVDVIDSTGADTFIDMKVIQNGKMWNYGNYKSNLEWCWNAQTDYLMCEWGASPTNSNCLWIEFSNLVPGSEVTVKVMCWGSDAYSGYDTRVELWDPDTMTLLASKKIDARFTSGLTGNPTGTVTANANASGKIVFACDSGYGQYGIINAATLTATAVPEPATLCLLGLGGIGLLIRRRRVS